MQYQTINMQDYIVHHYSEVDSTSNVCLQDVYQESPDKMVVIADMQNNGRGRLSNVWQSMQGNLMATIVLPLTLEKKEWANFSFISALAISDVISELTNGAKVEIKWANDVLVSGAKICGVLLEAQENTLCIGVGVNVLSAPVVGKYTTTSLANLGVDVDKITVLNMVLSRMNAWVQAYDASGLTGILPAYKARLKGLGQSITVRTMHEEYVGVFKDLSDAGHAVLLLNNGTTKEFSAGEMAFA